MRNATEIFAKNNQKGVSHKGQKESKETTQDKE